MRKVLVILVVGGLIGVASCATLVRSSTQSVTINSNVKAQISVGGRVLGVTPLTYMFDRQQNSVVLQAEAPGHRAVQHAMKPTLDIAFLGNLISGGPSGMTTDFVTGNMWEYKPNNVFINLAPLSMNKEQSDRFKRLSSMRHYILMNHELLAREIAEGSGDSLVQLQQALEALLY